MYREAERLSVAERVQRWGLDAELRRIAQEYDVSEDEVRARYEAGLAEQERALRGGYYNCHMRVALRRIGALTFALLALLYAACGQQQQETVARPSPSPSPAPQETQAPQETPTPTQVPAPQQLAFINDGDLWLIDEEGSGLRRLTDVAEADPTGGSFVERFGWLRDGLTIALEARRGFQSAGLLIDLDGNVLWERPITPRVGPIPYWAPDGTRVVLVDIIGISLEDRDGRLLAQLPLQAEHEFPLVDVTAAWAPTSQWFAFVDGLQIVVVNREGVDIRRLDFGPELVPGTDPPDRRILGPPSSSPDGKTLYVAGINLAVPHLPFWIYRVDLGEDAPPAALPETGSQGLPSLVLSPDGKRLAYRGDVRLPGGCHNAWIGVMDLESRDLQQVIAAALQPLAEEVQPPRAAVRRLGGFDWSSSGDGLIASFDLLDCLSGFEEPLLLARGLFLWNPQTGEERQLLDRGVRPRWSPDGRKVAFTVGLAPEEPSTVWILDVAIGADRQLTEGSSPQWRPQ